MIFCNDYYSYTNKQRYLRYPSKYIRYFRAYVTKHFKIYSKLRCEQFEVPTTETIHINLHF